MERVLYLSADGEIMISMITFEGGSHGHGVPGHGMPAPMPVPMPMPVPAPGMHHGSHHGHAPYPAAGMPGPYPAQPGMTYPAQPGMYPTQHGMHGGHQPSYAHLSPKSAVSSLLASISHEWDCGSLFFTALL